MLPFEAHLLAAGWPRFEPAPASSEDGQGHESDSSSGGGSGSGDWVLTREGSRGARMLFQARR